MVTVNSLLPNNRKAEAVYMKFHVYLECTTHDVGNIFEHAMQRVEQEQEHSQNRLVNILFRIQAHCTDLDE